MAPTGTEPKPVSDYDTTRTVNDDGPQWLHRYERARIALRRSFEFVPRTVADPDLVLP